MPLISFSKCSRCLYYTLLIACEFPTLITVDSPTLLVYGILIFGFDQYLFDGFITLEVGLDTILAAYLLDALS